MKKCLSLERCEFTACKNQIDCSLIETLEILTIIKNTQKYFLFTYFFKWYLLQNLYFCKKVGSCFPLTVSSWCILFFLVWIVFISMHVLSHVHWCSLMCGVSFAPHSFIMKWMVQVRDCAAKLGFGCQDTAAEPGWLYLHTKQTNECRCCHSIDPFPALHVNGLQGKYTKSCALWFDMETRRLCIFRWWFS